MVIASQLYLEGTSEARRSGCKLQQAWNTAVYCRCAIVSVAGINVSVRCNESGGGRGGAGKIKKKTREQGEKKREKAIIRSQVE